MQRQAQVRATVSAIIDRAGPGVTSSRRLEALGISRSRIATAVQRGELVSLRRGSVLPTSTWAAADGVVRHELAVQAAVLAHPFAVVSHTSAALLLGLPSPSGHPSPNDRAGGGVPTVHITIPGRRRIDGWLRIHGAELPAAHCMTVGGLAITGFGRTFADAAAMLDPGPALALADAAVRQVVLGLREGTDPRRAVLDEALRSAATRAVAAVVDTCRHRTGVQVARAALLRVDPASESVLESLSRWQMLTNRVPMPRCGIPIVGDDGRTYWTDFAWEDLKIIGEADGALKYATRADLLREKYRQEALERAGWLVIRWDWADAVLNPEVMIRRIERAIAFRRLHPPQF